MAAVLAASAAGLLTRDAGAYTVRKSADGTPVRWAKPEIEVTVDPSVIDANPGAPAAVAAAFSAWRRVADTDLPVVATVSMPADDVGFRPGGDNNRSTVRFASEGSPFAGAALAVTVLTFDDSGRIVDADIILNGGAARPFGVVDDGYAGAQPSNTGPGIGGAYDLQNVLTHEVGHFFGLGEEEQDTLATMFVTSARGETQKRDLAGDDESGLRELYVLGALESAQSGGCSTSGSRRGSDSGALYALGLALVAAAFVRRRRGTGTGSGAALLMLGVLGGWGATGCVAGTIEDTEIAEGADATATVTAAVSRWEGGLLVTSLELHTDACANDDCPATTRIEVPGGSAGGFTQVIGHRMVPALGDVIPLIIRDGRARWHDGPSRQPRDVPRGPGAGGNWDTPAVLPTKAKPDPRRTHERADAHLGVIIHGSDGELRGTTENISEGGLFVALDEASRTQAARGEAVSVTLQLPGRAAVHAVGEIRWVRGEGGGQEPAGIGIRFTELEGEDAEAIRDLVAEHEIL